VDGRDRFDRQTLSEARTAFDRLHEESYGFAVPDEDVEIVDVNVTAIGLIEKPRLARAGEKLAPASPAAKGERLVYFREAAGFVAARVFDRDLLDTGRQLQGPLLLEQIDSTIVVPPEWRATSTEHGLVVLER
jgi:N-methylhydantoinase A